MYNIRIKQLPKNGDQRNYSLVDRNDLYIKVNPINQDSNVKNTISAVPREEANIEAEGGETVIGDINNDGFLEHNKIVGKRHTEGGVPLNVAPGSFIFSDTKKLKIKDPEVLSIFGITNVPKGGITPAKIANKYPMNNYMNILKDDSTDPISKRTASKMLENSLEKLGMLALVQESMKGFPDGIPAIAESVMAGMQGPEMQGAPQEMMEGQEATEEGQMRYGGMSMYQRAGTVKQKTSGYPFGGNWVTNWLNTPHDFEGRSLTKEEYDRRRAAARQTNNKVPARTQTNNKVPAKGVVVQPKNTTTQKDVAPASIMPGTSFYINGKANSISQKYHGFFGDEWIKFKTPITVIDEDGDSDTMTEMTVTDWNKLTINKSLKMGYEDSAIAPSHYTDIANLDWWNQDRSFADIGRGVKYNTLTYSTTPVTAKPEVKKEMKPGYEFTQGNKKYKVVASDVYSSYGKGNGQTVSVEQIADPDQDFNSFFDTKFGKKLIPIDEYNKMLSLQSGVSQNDEYEPHAPNTGAEDVPTDDRQNMVALDTTLTQEDRNQKIMIKEDNAGAAPRRVQKAPVNVAPKNTNKAPATSSGIPVEYTNDFEYGGSLPEHQGTNQGVPSTVQPPKEKTIVKWQVSNTTGKKRPVYSDGTIGEPIEYNVADEDLRAQVGAKGYDFFDLPEDLRYKQKTVGPQTAQTGYKLDPESGFLYKDIKPGTRGLEEYMKIHADAINAYPGGAEKWKQDQIAGKGKANPAMKHLLEYENAAIGTLSGNKPYIDMSIEGALVPGVENYNLPGIRKKAPAGTPEVKQTVPEKKDIVARQIQNQPIAKRRRPWWLQDQVNFAGAMTDMVDKYGPAMAQVDLETPGYALEDPARQIAAMQENSAANREALLNTTAGNVAGASMASQSPTDLSNVANVIGNVQNRNVGTYTQASNIGAQINNQEQILNSNAEQKYIADSATANQQYANALRDLKWNRIKAFNQGTSNFQRTNQLESMFPQYGFDRMTGDIAFAGGREAYDENGNPLYDTYINPTTIKGQTGNNYDYNDFFTLKKKIKEQYPGASDDEIMQAIKLQTTGKFSSDPNNQFGQQVIAGKTLPQQIGRYGGYMKQYGGTVFDFGALPMYFFED